MVFLQTPGRLTVNPFWNCLLSLGRRDTIFYIIFQSKESKIHTTHKNITTVTYERKAKVQRKGFAHVASALLTILLHLPAQKTSQTALKSSVPVRSVTVEAITP